MIFYYICERNKKSLPPAFFSARSGLFIVTQGLDPRTVNTQ